ncbi:hypothetical protein FIBSPDRAFT_924011 [Athelia psychrophila]|uniref:Uncharacterized protein n=1 Tax=Athelia psychrophila TaxID=1759441 RepID=A0A166X7Q4_9AGAM|nr:hypothetical protein FIBSPDRAFT_924011 [Fibularhizoctonia sp. CBS 109695]
MDTLHFRMQSSSNTAQSSAAPEPPSMASFAFREIGRVPALFSRISDEPVDPGGSDNRWRSESPQSLHDGVDEARVSSASSGLQHVDDVDMYNDTDAPNVASPPTHQSLISRIGPSHQSSSIPSSPNETPIQTRVSQTGDRFARSFPKTTKNQVSHSTNQNPPAYDASPILNTGAASALGNAQHAKSQASPSRASNAPDLIYPPPTHSPEVLQPPGQSEHHTNIPSPGVDLRSASSSSNDNILIPTDAPCGTVPNTVTIGEEAMESTTEKMVHMQTRLQNVLAQTNKSRDSRTAVMDSPSLGSLRSQSPTASPAAVLSADLPKSQVQADSRDDSHLLVGNTATGRQDHASTALTRVLQIVPSNGVLDSAGILSQSTPPQSAEYIFSPQLETSAHNVQSLSIVPHNPNLLGDVVSPTLIQWIDDAPRARAELNLLSKRVSVAEATVGALRAELATSADAQANARAQATEATLLLTACQAENVALRNSLATMQDDNAALHKSLQEKEQELQRETEKSLQLERETTKVLDLAHQCLERIEGPQADSNPPASTLGAGEIPDEAPLPPEGVLSSSDQNQIAPEAQVHEQKLAQQLQERSKGKSAAAKPPAHDGRIGSASSAHNASQSQERGGLQGASLGASNLAPPSNIPIHHLPPTSPALAGQPNVQPFHPPTQQSQKASGLPSASHAAVHDHQNLQSTALSNESISSKDRRNALGEGEVRPAANITTMADPATWSRSNVSVKTEPRDMDVKMEDAKQPASAVPPNAPKTRTARAARRAAKALDINPATPSTLLSNTTQAYAPSASHTHIHGALPIQSSANAISGPPSPQNRRVRHERESLTNGYYGHPLDASYNDTVAYNEDFDNRVRDPTSTILTGEQAPVRGFFPTIPATDRASSISGGDGGWHRTPNLGQSEPHSFHISATRGARAMTPPPYRSYDHYSPPSRSPKTPPLPPPYVYRRPSGQYSPSSVLHHPNHVARSPARSLSPNSPYRPMPNRKRYRSRSRSRSADRYSSNQDHPSRRPWQTEPERTERPGSFSEYGPSSRSRNSPNLARDHLPPTRPLTPPPPSGITTQYGKREIYPPVYSDRNPPPSDLQDAFNHHRRASDSHRGSAYEPNADSSNEPRGRPSSLINRMATAQPSSELSHQPNTNKNLLDRMSESRGNTVQQANSNGENSVARKPIPQTYRGSPRGRGQGKTARGRGAGRGAAPQHMHNPLMDRMQGPSRGDLADRISSQ